MFSHSYTPQAQGAVERFNGTLKRHLLSTMTKHGTKDWLPLLRCFLRFYNHQPLHVLDVESGE